MTKKILITGGSGNLSQHIVPRLLKDGFSIRLASHSERKDASKTEVEWMRTSLETGDGLEEAVRDVDTIIHTASDPLHSQKIDIEGTRKVLDIAKRAGIGHFIHISIVGIEHFPKFAYYRAKLAAERLVESSSIPFTILRATQFHDLLDKYFLPLTFRFPLAALVPTDFKYQVIEIDEVAGRVAELVKGVPSGRVPDIGGPQILTMGELAQTWAKARGIKKPILHLPMFGNTARGFREGLLTSPSHKIGKITWEQYLARKYSKDS